MLPKKRLCKVDRTQISSHWRVPHPADLKALSVPSPFIRITVGKMVSVFKAMVGNIFKWIFMYFYYVHWYSACMFENVRFPRTGVTGSCKPSYNCGNKARVPCKSSRALDYGALSPGPLECCYLIIFYLVCKCVHVCAYIHLHACMWVCVGGWYNVNLEVREQFARASSTS